MSEIDIILLDNLNKAKEEINMIKPSSYQELLELLKQNLNNTKEEIKIIKPKTYNNLLKQIGKKFKNLSEYYDIFILDENNEEIKIDTEEEYEQVEDILFIREIDNNILEQSMFEINFNKLSESNKKYCRRKI